MQHKHLTLGDFESGKTTLAKWLAYLAPRTLVFDPVWEFGEGQHSVKKAREVYAETGRCVFQPYDAETAFEPFCAMAMQARNALVVIDEPALVLSALGEIPPNFNRLYRLGHKRGVGVLMATHRIKGDLPALMRMCHHFWVFRTTIDSDLDALKEYIGEEGVAWVRDAPEYAFWHHSGRHQGPVDPLGEDVLATIERAWP